MLRIAEKIKTLPEVTAATTATKLGDGKDGPSKAGILVHALSTNTAAVFLGDDAVTNATGVGLAAGETLHLAVQDESKVFAISVAGTQKLRVMKLF